MKKIIFNHKMSLTQNEVKNYIQEIKNKIPTDYEVIICPSMIYLPFFDGKYSFKLGAQNCNYGKFGDYTGEASCYQLKSLNVSYALIGHNERRKLFKEDNLTINKKIDDALYYGINPILCIGESLEEKNLNKTFKVLERQIKEALNNIDEIESITIAYESNWLQTDNIKLQEIEEIVSSIKELIFKMYQTNVKIIYGGKVNEKNIKQILSSKIIDGVLIGSSSSNVEKVNNLLKSI